MTKNHFEIDEGRLPSVASELEEFLSSGTAGTSLDRHIEWVDTDAAGHQHNSVIMRLVEATEAKLFRELGVDSYFSIAPRVRQEIDYRAKLYFGQQVSAAVVIERIGTSSMAFVFKVWGHRHEGRESVLAAQGRFVTVCVPEGAQESAPWPTAVLVALKQ
ncbi:acyl-CoA thioesterase [Paeniglutamicibacter antarcticus]|uniref:Acyl-CoA thioester hydrolase n=1 Tax=Paeniglutamicibacter antarcticus TaxID=494023 RepID=A0ABP9TJC8_9MICC